MPLIKSTYTAPRIFRNAHISTVYAALLRKVELRAGERERIELTDGDFLDLDRHYSTSGPTEKIVICLHGLEGNAQRPYMRGICKHFIQNGWDAAAMNFRSCSGEQNRLYKSYNAGATLDLAAVINHVLQRNQYSTIVLVGFSLGGNLMLKYLGETQQLPLQIKAAVAVSVPCDLSGSLKRLGRHENHLYSRRFLRSLKKQLYQRQLAFPEKLDRKQIAACNSLLAIDELYTSKAHGYKDAADYYEQCSSLRFLSDIEIPTLLINARNDSFLSPESFPKHIAKTSKYLHLEIPEHGGHVGFIQHEKPYYHEERALKFIENFI